MSSIWIPRSRGNVHMTTRGWPRAETLASRGSTESLSNREQLPRELLSGLERPRPSWFLDMKYLLFHYTSVETDVCKGVVYWTVLHYHPLLVSYFCCSAIPTSCNVFLLLFLSVASPTFCIEKLDVFFLFVSLLDYFCRHMDRRKCLVDRLMCLVALQR